MVELQVSATNYIELSLTSVVGASSNMERIEGSKQLWRASKDSSEVSAEV